MAKSKTDTVDMAARVSSALNGSKGFAHSKKVKQLGIDGYSQWLTGKMTEKVVSQSTDPRRLKRLARKES